MQIREMFRLFNMRISQRQVAEMLQSKGYRTTYNGNLNRYNIRPLLENKEKMSKEEAVVIASSLCDVIDSGNMD